MATLPPLPPELAHLTREQQLMIFGQKVGGGHVTPTVERYNQVINELRAASDPNRGTMYGGLTNLMPISQAQAPAPVAPTMPGQQPRPQVQAPIITPPSAGYQRDPFTGVAPVIGTPPPLYQRLGGMPQAPVAGTEAPPLYERPPFELQPRPGFEGTYDPPRLMSLDEMMEIIDRQARLRYDEPVAAKYRGLEEELLSGEKRRGDLQAAYEEAKEDLRLAGQEHLREAADTMRHRGLYDSGLAADSTTRIHQSMIRANMKIGLEQARVLADLAEYLDLRTRHTQEEIQGMLGEKALFAQTLLDEMHQRQETRKDMLAQQEFENWLANMHLNLTDEANQRAEYWRQVGFDSEQMENAYTRHWNDKMFQWQRYESELENYWRAAGFDAERSAQEYARYMDRFQMEWQLYQSQLEDYWRATGFDFNVAQHEYQKYWDQVQFAWQQHESQLNEYWRQVGYDAQMSQQAYDRYWNQVQFDWNKYMAQVEQNRWANQFAAGRQDAAWERIMQMNEFQLNQEIQRLLANNQMTQWEAEHALARDKHAMQDAVYRAMYG